MSKNKEKSRISYSNPHEVKVNVDDDFDFVDEDEPIVDQKFCVISFYEPKDDLCTLRELFFFEEFIKEALREDPELDKKRVNFSKVTPQKLINLYHDFRFDNIDELNVKAREKYPDVVFERAVKVRGSYKSESKANDRKTYLKRFDQVHSQYVAEVGKWLPFNPPESSIADYETSNKRLNEMMRAQRANMQEAKEFYEKERAERIKQSVALNEKKRNAIKNNDEETILAEKREQEILGLLPGDASARRAARQKPSKANTIAQNALPEEHGIVGQTSTKNYKSLVLRPEELEHRSHKDFKGDVTTQAEYANNTMAGDVKAIKEAKNSTKKSRLRMEDFDEAEFDEERAQAIASNIVQKRSNKK